MKKIAFLQILLCLIWAACQNNSTKKLNNENIAGTWSNTLMKMKFESYKNTTKDSTLIVTKDNWVEILKIQPIKTTFEINGTYKSEYFGSDGKFLQAVSGKYWFQNDSVVLKQLLPKEDFNAYKTKIWGNSISFETNIDFDSDGKKDDYYYGEQEKIY